MCGIWALTNLVEDKPDIAKYLADFWAINKRGPDSSCLQTFPQAWIGFHRLAVMDMSFDSNQPFVFHEKDRTVVFICNGEVYNFKKLITKYGLEIDNKSDCKTIPQLYIKFSKAGKLDQWYGLFEREIKGEFAFVLFEFDHLKTLRQVVAGRDMVGVRPLYYHHPIGTSKHLIFTSEIKGASNFPDKVEEFKPGQLMTFQMNEFGSIKVVKKSFDWIYQVVATNKSRSEAYYLTGIRDAVINSVRRRLDSDRPLAFLNSGGVDSSLVVGIASKILGTPVKTFCCGMKGGTDLYYAKMVADHVKSNHTEVYFTAEDGIKALDEVIYATETWDTTTIRASVGQYLVCKYIGEKTDARVVMVGEGPDEVCSSYMFNWYAPSAEDLDNCAKDLVRNIHVYDCKRSDRCISVHGLEGRVPLLDPEVIEAYWSIPAEWRMPKYKGIEKWWLRKAFDGLDIIPDEVLWRKKEAFSDGVSSKEKSWYMIIQEKCEDLIDDQMLTKQQAPSKEACYFKMKFIDTFGENRLNIIPHYWLPRWNSSGEVVTNYMDPSARALDVYDE